ncbi:hypothetical protein BUZ84_06985 [Mammaliicoccus sciuri]|uniref:hypothetical protein n=1 Tax=Mammaliicoccus sciuri TaxID=1296 RepID=UPI000D1E3C9F|nr:hypothetical protein [Mammaliicoccus sciuri]PTJ81291.1 hypothetical protein BUZ84_06985 [Mammaliicoccus sciuri]
MEKDEKNLNWQDSVIANFLYLADKKFDFDYNKIFEKSNSDLVSYINGNFEVNGGKVILDVVKDPFINNFSHPYSDYREANRKLGIENSFLLLVYLVFQSA